MLIGCISSNSIIVIDVILSEEICRSTRATDRSSCSVSTCFRRSVNESVSSSKSSGVNTECHIQFAVCRIPLRDITIFTTSHSTNCQSCSTNREGIALHPSSLNIIEEDLSEDRIGNNVDRSRITSSTFCIIEDWVRCLSIRNDVNNTICTSSTSLSNTSSKFCTRGRLCTCTILSVRESQWKTSVSRIGLIKAISTINIHCERIRNFFLSSSRTPNETSYIGSG